MGPHMWRKRSSFTIGGYMWTVLNQANILKRYSVSVTIPVRSTQIHPKRLS
jgi:hypothetical protein